MPQGRGRRAFGWPWALLGWLGRRGHCLLCRRMSVRASPRGDSCDSFCPLNLPSEGTGSLTQHFNEQSISRDQQEFFPGDRVPRETQRRNEAKQLYILSNFEGELPTTSTAQANLQCSVASLLMRHKQIAEGSFLPDSHRKLFRDCFIDVPF